MHSKFNTQKLHSNIRYAWTLSILGHASLLVLFLATVFLKTRPKTEVEFTVFENPQVSNQVPQISKPKMESKKTPSPKGVFGVSRRSLTTTETSAPSSKLGNTVAKEQDQKTLNENDPDSLPIPSDEVLVSQMPELLGEIKVPYPPEAKQKGIEGPVIFELLIDDHGRVRQAVLLDGPGAGLNEAAIEAVKKLKFSPALIQEKPVAVKIRYAYRFVLER